MMTTDSRPTQKHPIPAAQENEIRIFEEMIAKLEAGELDTDDFRRFRLENGC